MELKELKIVFDAGGLTQAVVKDAPLMGGYILTFKTKTSRAYVMTSQRGEEQPRAFKSIDAAVANAQKVGFMKVLVDLNH